jgi:hypothetical protein
MPRKPFIPRQGPRPLPHRGKDAARNGLDYGLTVDL